MNEMVLKNFLEGLVCLSWSGDRNSGLVMERNHDCGFTLWTEQSLMELQNDEAAECAAVNRARLYGMLLRK